MTEEVVIVSWEVRRPRSSTEVDVEFVRDMGDGAVCRALARRLELRGGMDGAVEMGEGMKGWMTGMSGIGQVGGGVGAES